MERINEAHAAPIEIANDEVTRQADTFNLQPDAPGDFAVDYGQSDRQPQPPIDHLIEVTVARIAIETAIALKTQIVKQESVERSNRIERGVNARADVFCPFVQLIEI